MLALPESLVACRLPAIAPRAAAARRDRRMPRRRRTPIVRRAVALPEDRDAGRHASRRHRLAALDDDGQLHGAICLFTDLTAVKDLEEQLRLKDSLATVGELTAGIAHEFRNGLATIHGYSKLLDLQALPAAYRPYVEGHPRGDRVAQPGGDQLPQLRAAGAADAHRRRSRRASASAPPKRFAPTRARSAATSTCAASSATIEGDEVLLRQAFSNLLRNALEACVGAAAPPRIVIQSELDQASRLSRIAVNDNGPGIAPALRERVFRPFFTLKRNGTGLGLALVQKIIVFHNGRIVVGTSPDGGASLQITLPTTA